MSGKQRLKSEHIVRSCRSDAWSRSKSAGGAALPMEGEKASHAACLQASLIEEVFYWLLAAVMLVPLS